MERSLKDAMMRNSTSLRLSTIKNEDDLLPPLILDSVCYLKPFQVKVKSVQGHLDHYLFFSNFCPPYLL